MKTLIILIPLIAAGVTYAIAQNDSIQYIQGLPMTNEDTVQRVVGDIPPKNVLIEIPKERIPEKLKRTLGKEELYRGWEKFPVYQDNNTKLYILSIIKGNTTRTYGFSENGKPVTYQESTKKE